MGTVVPAPGAAHSQPAGHDRTTEFYAPGPTKGAKKQIADLRSQGRKYDAALIGAMAGSPTAVWFTGSPPAQTRAQVKQVVNRAAGKDQVPVLVAYNIPFRDCAQFSAGGATTTEEYLQWIDAFADGIGKREAVVILEPDGLGIIPYHVDLSGTMEWCQPPEANPATAADERYFQLNEALDRLNEQPNVSVYLDGTHSRWLGVGDAARRLVRAGVARAAGFFTNVSNYQFTAHELKYGTWISKCIAFANNPEEGGWRLDHYDWCASQYFPADVNDFSTWHRTDEWYDANLGTAVPTTHYVTDTSRNGQGRWIPSASYPDPQDWCNPPGRGLGLRAATDTGNALADAFLWVKVPGESDGQCNRGLGPPGETVDPEWGIVDPPAGAWFPQQALELAQLASPPLNP